MNRRSFFGIVAGLAVAAVLLAKKAVASTRRLVAWARSQSIAGEMIAAGDLVYQRADGKWVSVRNEHVIDLVVAKIPAGIATSNVQKGDIVTLVVSGGF